MMENTFLKGFKCKYYFSYFESRVLIKDMLERGQLVQPSRKSIFQYIYRIVKAVLHYFETKVLQNFCCSFWLPLFKAEVFVRFLGV